jgi:parvulin-like peptidyl-prolyl isomerase
MSVLSDRFFSPALAVGLALVLWMTPVPSARALPSAQGDHVVARLELTPITFGDLLDEARFARLNGATDAEMDRVLVGALNRRLLAHLWPKSRPLPDDSEGRAAQFIEQEMNRLEKEFQGEAGMKQALEMLHWRKPQLAEFLYRRYSEALKIQLLVLSDLKTPTKDEIASYEQKLKDEGQVVEVYWISHLFISDEQTRTELELAGAGVAQATSQAVGATLEPALAKAPQLTDREVRLAAEEKALTAWRRWKGGESFDRLVRELSEDAVTAPISGYLGRFSKQQLAPEFRSVLTTMRPGDVSLPVRAQSGYHLLQLNRKRTAETALRAEQRLEARKKLLKRAKEEVNWEIVDAEFKEVYERYSSEIKEEYVPPREETTK